MKNKLKKLAVLGAVFVTLTCGGMTVMADEWKEEVDGWYYHANGQAVTNKWVRGENGFYYLSDSGVMATNELIEGSDGKMYYVNEFGIRVKDEWRFIERDEDTSLDGHWYYFDVNGRMVTGKRSIGGEKYFFDETGRMLTGWVTIYDGLPIQLEEEINRDLGDIYYCRENGTRLSGWIELNGPDSGSDPVDPGRYHFEGNGKLHRNTKAGIDGKDYCFGEDGRMLNGWVYKGFYQIGADEWKDLWIAVDEDTSDEMIQYLKAEMGDAYPSRYYYCGATEPGVVYKNDWLQTVGYGSLKDADEGPNWFFFEKDGTLTCPSNTDPLNRMNRGVIAKVDGNGTYKLKEEGTQVLFKKINNKYYMFNSEGKLLDGLIYIQDPGSSIFTKGYYAFTNGGAKVTGTYQKDGYHYYFSKSYKDGAAEGAGITDIRSGRAYYCGLSVYAGADMEYQIVYVEGMAESAKDSGMFVVDEKGKIKTGTVTLEDGMKYRLVKLKDDGVGYRIYRILEDGTEVLVTKDDVIEGAEKSGGKYIYKYVPAVN